MGKRLVIKTLLICVGVFLILDSLMFTYIFKKYPLDMEKHVSVVVASVDIKEGMTIEERFLRTKEVPESAVNSSMVMDLGSIAGKKVLTDMHKDDYIRSYDLLDRKAWYKDDERIIVLPVSMEERLANLIKKGSLVDIRLQTNSREVIDNVLYKVRVEDVLDESGTPIGSKSAVNSKTAYLELILDKDERQKIYSAMRSGKLVYELYCDNTQKTGVEVK
ncbi:MAG TPA: SAF domain-containing protein [Ruminiclostridium sp.]|nr:SAF domain-containing protein [Ruminiclostridium sp.]